MIILLLTQTECMSVENGKCLARAISKKQIKRLAETQEQDVMHFQRHMEDFAMEFLSADETFIDTEGFPIGDLEVDLAALRDQWNKEKDMGIGEFATKDEQELREYLTIRDGCPEAMRRWTCENYKHIPVGTAEKFEGAIEFKPMWHQLAAVAAIFKRLTFTDQADVHDTLRHDPSHPESAPRSLREGWSRVPGTLIDDDVGLGKTVTTATWIATVIQLLEVQRAAAATLSPEEQVKHRPRCLGGMYPARNFLAQCSCNLYRNFRRTERDSFRPAHHRCPKRSNPSVGRRVEAIFQARSGPNCGCPDRRGVMEGRC